MIQGIKIFLLLWNIYIQYEFTGLLSSLTHFSHIFVRWGSIYSYHTGLFNFLTNLIMF